MSQTSPQQDRPGPVLRMLLPIFRWLWPRVGTPIHVRWYRLLSGRLAGQALLLTTLGRRSGRPRAIIVGYLLDGEDLIVADSNVTKPAVPSWVLNLRAHPEAEVQLGKERYRVGSEVLEGEDRETQWDRLVAADPGYAWVQRLTGRELTVIRFRRVKGSPE